MAKSVVSSLFDLYASIGASNFGGTDRPPLFLGEAAQTTSTGTQQRVPYCVLYDEGFRPEFFSDASAIEPGEIRLEAFALQLDAASGVTVDSIVRAVKWGGSAPSAKAGFDWGAFSFASGSHLYKISMQRTFERRSYAGFTTQGPNGETARVHKCELRWKVTAGLSPS